MLKKNKKKKLIFLEPYLNKYTGILKVSRKKKRMRDKKNTSSSKKSRNKGKGQKGKKDKEESSSSDENDIILNDSSWENSLYEIQWSN